MRKLLVSSLLCTILLSVGPPSVVRAQEGPGAAPQPERVQPGELQRLFDAYFVANIQEALGLSDDQFSQIIPMLKQLQQARREHQQRRRQQLQELRRLSTSLGSDEAQIREHLKALGEIDDRFPQEQRRAFGAIDGLLNVRQQARFRVYEQEMEQRKLDLIGRFQRNEAGARQNRLRRQMPPPHHH